MWGRLGTGTYVVRGMGEHEEGAGLTLALGACWRPQGPYGPGQEPGERAVWSYSRVSRGAGVDVEQVGNL